jgi:hypothetical protein
MPVLTDIDRAVTGRPSGAAVTPTAICPRTTPCNVAFSRLARPRCRPAHRTNGKSVVQTVAVMAKVGGQSLTWADTIHHRRARPAIPRLAFSPFQPDRAAKAIDERMDLRRQPAAAECAPDVPPFGIGRCGSCKVCKGHDTRNTRQKMRSAPGEIRPIKTRRGPQPLRKSEPHRFYPVNLLDVHVIRRLAKDQIKRRHGLVGAVDQSVFRPPLRPPAQRG